MGVCWCKSTHQQHEAVRFPDALKNQVVCATIERVIDGDTIMLHFWLPELFACPIVMSARLVGFNAPETSKHGQRHVTEEEKLHGRACGEYLRRILSTKQEWLVRVHELDVYNRLLVSFCDQTVADRMLNETPCIVYDGKSKAPPVPLERCRRMLEQNAHYAECVRVSLS
jgi:endonuclease YncB( thermonuclease family)